MHKIKCSNCKKLLDISCFHKNNKIKRGYQYDCIECKKKTRISYQLIKNKVKELRIKYPERYILYDIKTRCNNKNCKAYKNYGGRGIKCLITEKEIKQLMIRDNYWSLKRPSIDRINNNGNYTYDNCRFIEMSENSAKDSCKPVLQFSLDGKFIREFKGIREAGRCLKINSSSISGCCKKRYKSAGGYIWKYKI